MVTNVYKFDLSAMDNKDKYIKEHPEAYLFTYDGEIPWEWKTIEVDGKTYRHCMGSCSKENPKTFFVEEFTFRSDMSSITSGGYHASAYCPACGYPIDWEAPDGEVECDECYSKINKRSCYYIDIDDYEHLDYQTSLIEVRKPNKLDPDKISYKEVVSCG